MPRIGHAELRISNHRGRGQTWSRKGRSSLSENRRIGNVRYPNRVILEKFIRQTAKIEASKQLSKKVAEQVCFWPEIPNASIYTTPRVESGHSHGLASMRYSGLRNHGTHLFDTMEDQVQFQSMACAHSRQLCYHTRPRIEVPLAIHPFPCYASHSLSSSRQYPPHRTQQCKAKARYRHE